MQELIDALHTLRLPPLLEENELHARIGAMLAEKGFPVCHEVRLGKGMRIDFVSGTVGIEIKKGRPNTQRMLAQAGKYLGCEQLKGLILVVERTVPLPDTYMGKPIHVISLRSLWGISL